MRSRGFALIIVLVTISVVTSVAQIWTVTDPSLIEARGTRDIIPTRFVTYSINTDAIQKTLRNAPDESGQAIQTSNTLLTVGLADGQTDVFRIVEYSMMEEELSRQFPEIKTYRGISISNPYRTIRTDWTENGFRAIIRDQQGMTYIDPFQRGDTQHCIVYHK